MGRHSAPGQTATEPTAEPATAPDAHVHRGRHAGPAVVAEPTAPAEPPPPVEAAHHRHAGHPIEEPSLGPSREVLAWTGFAAVVAWATIAAGHDLSDATAWALGGAAVVPVALLSLTPAWLRERRARRRDQ